MNKRLLARKLFHALGMPFNVEFENDEYPRLVIGGLTPRWHIEEQSKGNLSVVRIKWVNGKFARLKSVPVKSFRVALLYIVSKEASEEMDRILGEAVSSDSNKSARGRNKPCRRLK